MLPPGPGGMREAIKFAEPQANGVADPERLGLQSFQSYRSRLFQLD